MTTKIDNKSRIVKSMSFIDGLLTQVDDEHGSRLDVLFPTADGTTKEFGHILSDIERILIENGYYAEFRVTVHLREGGELTDDLLPGFGG